MDISLSSVNILKQYGNIFHFFFNIVSVLFSLFAIFLNQTHSLKTYYKVCNLYSKVDHWFLANSTIHELFGFRFSLPDEFHLIFLA